MTKKEIVRRIAAELNADQVLTKKILQRTLEIILETLAAGGTVIGPTNSRSRPFVVDWDGDGIGDVLCGGSDGYVRLYLRRPSRQAFAYTVLPTVIFFASLTAVLFHLGVLQLVVRGMARLMVWVMDTSGSESLSTAANVFVGMNVAPLTIRPYLATMTRSELMAMMTGGMATVAGGTMAAYAAMGADAGHLMVASVMSAPAALVVAKIMVPETEESLTKGVVKIDVPRTDSNVLDAACRGAGEGLKLALNIAEMLIAFIALVYLCNWALSALPAVGGEPLSLERILGWLFSPLAWIMGVEWKDAHAVGTLLGEKTVFNEFIAYQHLTTDMKDTLSPRSVTIATYALCGFANFGSIAVMIGGIGGLAPTRRRDFAQLGFRSLVGGSLAAFMTASVAGMLIGE